MANKALIGIVIVLAFVIVGLVVFYVLPSSGSNSGAPSGSSGNQTTKGFTGDITSAEFQVFPAGTQLKPGMTGTVTSSFKASDLVSISGVSDVSKPVVVTLKILDANGNDTGTVWHGNEITIQSGTFGFGSISIPQTPGNYTLKIYLDNYESKEMPFQIVQ